MWVWIMIDNKTLRFQFTDKKHDTNREIKIIPKKRQPAFGIKRPVCRCPRTRRLSAGQTSHGASGAAPPWCWAWAADQRRTPSCRWPRTRPAAGRRDCLAPKRLKSAAPVPHEAVRCRYALWRRAERALCWRRKRNRHVVRSPQKALRAVRRVPRRCFCAFSALLAAGVSPVFGSRSSHAAENPVAPEKIIFHVV